MEKEVIRHIYKYAKAMYVMVSIPEIKEENIYESPVILGCFKTKNEAKAAWKARTQLFCIECPVNRLVNITVPLIDVAQNIDSCNK